MPIKYVLVEKSNPLKPEKQKRIYAQVKSTGAITLKMLSKEIASDSTTVNDTDVLAVLNNLAKALSRNLAEGRIVRFGDFGSLQIGISSQGAENTQKFNDSHINGAKVNFRPGAELKEIIASLKFEKEN
jgi:predicted histone-like DNA-binding protein